MYLSSISVSLERSYKTFISSHKELKTALCELKDAEHISEKEVLKALIKFDVILLNIIQEHTAIANSSNVVYLET